MKKLFTIILVLMLTSTIQAQVRNYKLQQEDFLTQLQNKEISIDTYISLTTYQLSGLKDSISIVREIPHYNASLDLAVIGGGVLYQKFGNNVKYDYILHFWGGYFATKAMTYGLYKAGINKTLCATIPPVFTSILCALKEYMLDSQVSKGDLYAGIGGAGLASISFTVDIEKLFKKK